MCIAALASAVMHVGWNMLAKSLSAPRDLLFGVSIATATLCGVAFPFLGPPPGACWPWIGTAAVCNVLYLHMLTAAYSRSPFAVAYAVTRAVVPPVLLVLGWVFLAEPGRRGACLGLMLVVGSLLLFALAKSDLRELKLNGLLFAAAAGLILSCALWLEVKGIWAGGPGLTNLFRVSAASSLTTALGVTAARWASFADPFAPLRDKPGLCYLGSVLLLASYLCGMWAYAQGPIGLVAAVRESGILFGGGLAVLVLRERVSKLQWAAIAAATMGIVLVQIG